MLITPLRNLIQLGFLLGLVVLIFSSSCKKNPNLNNGTGGTTGSVYQDTLLALARETYYWNENIPKSFNPLAYQLYIAASDSSPETEAIKLYSPLNSVNNLHYDHFSFLLTEAEYQSLFVTGVSQRYGMDFTQDRAGLWRISYVAHASPAYSQGVRRGFQLVSINGIALTTNLSSSTLNTLNGILQYNTSASFVFNTPLSSSPVTLQINQGSFGDDECITTRVVKSGSKVIGYMAYNTFLTQFDNVKGALHPGLDTSFAGFADKGVTDLIIDLRYNGGGYTSIAEQLDNAVLPSSVDGQVMYLETFNDSLNYYHKTYPKLGFPGDSTVYISKTNPYNPASLSINNIVFIVSNETTSAAELVINNLKPYFPNLKLVGLGKSFKSTQQNTGGKPFGYAGSQPIPQSQPQYESFLINFETRNSLGQDNYISGFTPDVQEYDGVEYDWGDSNEDGYKSAFNYLATGVLAANLSKSNLSFSKTGASAVPNQNFTNKLRARPRFTGMLSTHVQNPGSRNIKARIQKAKASKKLL
jgi:C-terminal processing protease CtpA/Prc